MGILQLAHLETLSSSSFTLILKMTLFCSFFFAVGAKGM